jgi:isopenicillin N synthase-like dioxygenase
VDPAGTGDARQGLNPADWAERNSAPFFFNPSPEATYAPLTTSEPARYRPIRWGEFRANRSAGDYADVGEEIQISHYRIGAA